jgi:cobalt-zinc-cadmium efflux system protein
MKILMSSATESLNMKGAYLEVLSDALGSVGVIIGAVIIYYTNWYWVDTIIAVAIGFGSYQEHGFCSDKVSIFY